MASKSHPPNPSTVKKNPEMTIWWSNAIFFVSVHIAAAIGVWFCPWSTTSWKTLAWAFVVWQSAQFGITIGYHRLYSHRAFRANFGVKVVLAALGSSAFQGSIKWWCLRHRLHHRFTDDPVHDPYAATKGLLYSHMGWIFFKPRYEKMELVDREDLENDSVVRFQHQYYVPLALFCGFVMPTAVGAVWGDTKGAYVWAGLVTRLLIWHCTFLVNSLAHWDGLQPYSDDDTSRGNLLLALLTCGEGSHNFHHAFPHDFRSGPSRISWDPSKWIILALHRAGLITGLRTAREDDIKAASNYMSYKTIHGIPPLEEDDARDVTTWTVEDMLDYVKEQPETDILPSCLILVGGWVVDVTKYLGEHPGGSALLRSYSLKLEETQSDLGHTQRSFKWKDATWAFEGGLNNHSRGALRRMKELRIARFKEV